MEILALRTLTFVVFAAFGHIRSAGLIDQDFINEIVMPTSGVDQSCACPKGNVSDCCCTFADVEESNTNVVHALLKRVVATPFFAHFKVDLCSECRLWSDQPLCTLRDCSVCECSAPPTWAETVSTSCEVPEVASLDDRVTPSADDHIINGWQVSDHSSSDGGEPPKTTQAVVVDLRENPERYTGYGGDSAAHVWNAVHTENSYDDNDGSALSAEQRLYNRVISGLHSSISLHISNDYCLERDPLATYDCAQWGSNLAEARGRVMDHPERVENLYVTYAVLLRAVVRAGDAITSAVPANDTEFADGLREWEAVLLPEIGQLNTRCPQTFDESSFFTGPEGVTQKDELDRRLKHLLEIMRCVGCDRCKLWGTMQTLGVSTALRVLFPMQPGHVKLSRQEAVALVHTLERLSSSIGFARDFRSMTSLPYAKNAR